MQRSTHYLLAHHLAVLFPSTPSLSCHVRVQVLLKIIKHCHECLPGYVTGQLLGVDVNETLEITHSFAMPDTEDGENDGDFALEMMSNLREVNVDTYNAGFYQSAYMNEFFTRDQIQKQYEYQLENPNRVCIVFDPFKSRQGRLSLRALRLTAQFMQLYRTGKLTAKQFTQFRVDSTTIFEEMPIKVRNSHLVHAFLYDIRDSRKMDCSTDRLALTSNDTVERVMSMIGGPEGAFQELLNEQNQYQFNARRLAAAKADLQRQIEAVEDDNIRNRALGKELKPLPDASSLKVSEPSRLETFVASAKVDAYCRDLTDLATQTYVKQAMLRAFTRDEDAAPAPAPVAAPAAASE